jgi:GTP cyclohydrolase I
MDQTLSIENTGPQQVTFVPEHFASTASENSIAIAGAVSLLLAGIGEDTAREGLLETPERVAKAWASWTAGYSEDPKDILKSFEERDYDEMVIVRDIPVYSKCEHHLADIFGTATVAYIPNGRVLGLSKLSRLVNIYARRLQVQERLTVQIADALHTSELNPVGVGVMLRCRHMCMESRGICQQGHHTITTALRGEIKKKRKARSEFLALAK